MIGIPYDAIAFTKPQPIADPTANAVAWVKVLPTRDEWREIEDRYPHTYLHQKLLAEDDARCIDGDSRPLREVEQRYTLLPFWSDAEAVYFRMEFSDAVARVDFGLDLSIPDLMAEAVRQVCVLGMRHVAKAANTTPLPPSRSPRDGDRREWWNSR